MKINRYALDLLCGVAVPLSVTFLLLFPLLVNRGVPFYGDETFYYLTPQSFSFNLLNQLFSWIPGQGSASPPMGLFSYVLPLTVLTRLLGLEYGVKLYIFFVAALPGILSYFGFKILAKEWNLTNNESKTRGFALIGAMLILVPFFNSALVDVATSSGWLYAMFPFMFALIIKYINHGSFKTLVLLGICSLFVSVKPNWIYLIAIVTAIYLLVDIIKNKKINIAFFKRVILAVGILFFFNAFWLLSSLAGYSGGAGGIFGYYTTSNLISFESLLGLSHWNLIDVIMLGEHEFYFFWLHPQNYTLLNLSIPLITASTIFLYRKSRYTIVMALTLIVGIFLTKGANEPAGYLYYLIAQSLPYGAGAILRNPTRFIDLVILSYAFFVGLFFVWLYPKLTSFNFKRSFFRSKTFRYSLVVGVIFLAFVPLTNGTLQDLQGYTWLRYNPTDVPKSYDDVNNWLLSQPGDFKVMWIPSDGSYVWKPYVLTAFPDLLSSKPYVKFSEVYPEPWKSTDKVGSLLSILGVKYLIYHGDSIDYNNNEVLNDIVQQEDLRMVYSSNLTYRLIDNSNVPLPAEQDNFKFSGSPFVLNYSRPFIFGQETSIVLSYKIPQILVEKGFTNQAFNESGIMVLGVTAGETEMSDPNLIFQSSVSSQTLVNGTDGFARFNFVIPQSCVGKAIDVYAYYYGKSYAPLTAQYFIDRFLLSSDTVSVPILVFENLDYHGQIYARNLALTFGFGEDFLLNTEFNTSSWGIGSLENDLIAQNRPDAKMLIYNKAPFPNWVNEYINNSNPRLAYLAPDRFFCNGSFSFPFYALNDGGYTIAVKTNGTISAVGTGLVAKTGEWTYIGPMDMKSGNNTINLMGEDAYIESLIILGPNQEIVDLQGQPLKSTIVNIKQVSNVEWRVIVNSSESFVLILTEPYDSLWVANVNGEKINSVPLYSKVNGFLINGNGTFEIVIKYELQDWYNLSWAVSLVAFAVSAIYLSYPLVRKFILKYSHIKQA